ncbi:uncharacterized protein LOC132198326 [Neocloeon triangulifer]|uniref:uncharacterized protein LOC132198326 n=1 Tax=Neocloeon triangulifer TaxID=2078957 RepID=UPI00286F394F|nr:uncharacterized protein LOC132198326 [Neocloeon triangulifer]
MTLNNPTTLPLMKKMRGRLSLVLLGLLAAINTIHAALINVIMSNDSFGSIDLKLLHEQVQTLTTQARLSDALLKPLLETVDKVADELKALNQEPTAASNTNDTINLDCEVWKNEDLIDHIQQRISTLENEKINLLLNLLQLTYEENESLYGKYRNASRQQLLKRQGKFWEFQISVNCTLADRHAPKLMQLSNGKKYFFSYPAVYGNWSEADEKCKGMGLHLATIRDEVDLNSIRLEAMKKKKNFGWWWLSAKNYGNSIRTHFLWLDGSELEESSALWSANADKKECVSFIADPNKKLQGSPCTLKAFFICEYPAECSCSKKSD